MSQFSLSRFTRVIQNDALRIAKPVVFGTLALLGLTVLIYLTNFTAGHVTDPPVHEVLFGIFLVGAGLIVTSMAFQDMHHPLERYQYLMLPCSNVERILSRYLLTGPLFILYAVVAFSGMDWLGNLLTDAWKGAREPLFSPFSVSAVVLLRVYLGVHIVMLTGAICFRSYALIKTALSVILLLVGLAATSYVATRIFYWDAFTWNRFGPDDDSLNMLVAPIFTATWANVAVVTGFALWILYVAYRCLSTHEVQDEL
ncbi:MAG: hypothetical protein ABIP38_02515 [Steroidobacteraceae bacterium]